MCLKEKNVIFLYTVVATLCVSVMFVLSCRFGNLHTVIADETFMVAEFGDRAQEYVENILTNALILFMLMPLALAGDVTTVFRYDGKAGFAKVGASLPVSLNRRIMARFVTVIILFATGIAVDLIISFILSLITDIVSFREFFGIIISSASLMGIYGFLTLFFIFCFGFGKEEYAQIIAIATMLISFLIINRAVIIRIINSIAHPETENFYEIDIMISFTDFIKNKYYIMLSGAVLVMLCSYIGAVVVENRKRNMI